MYEDELMSPMSYEEQSRRREELLLQFCKDRGLDPSKLDATHLNVFYETPEMKRLLARKYR